MKTCMPLDGFRWSCDSDSALCYILQTNVFGRTGGGVQKGAVCLYLYRFTRSSLITPLQFRPNAKS